MTDKNEVIQTKNLSLINILLVFCLVAALALSWISFAKVKTVEARLEHMPPIVVVDFVSLVGSYGDLPPAELEERMVETRDAISALTDAGYLVLDAASTVSSPEDLKLTNILSGGK